MLAPRSSRRMSESSQSVSSVIRFGAFEADFQTRELRNHGVRLRLPGQSFQILKMLLERPGQLVTREELQKALWPSDTFVDFDHSLNAAMNRLREALSDSAEEPRLVETLPRRGYRFIAPLENSPDAHQPVALGTETQVARRTGTLRLTLLLAAYVLLAGVGLFVYKWTHVPASTMQRALTRLTFDDGLQIGATWSPDGRFVAYSSDRGGKFDVWVQQVSGGEAVRVTKGSGHNWQPDWSPDGKYIAYRSEGSDGGLFVIPALGGAGLERRITTFGYYPRWSPDSSQLLFQTGQLISFSKFFAVKLDGSDPHEVLSNLTARVMAISAAWHPDGKRISIWVLRAPADLEPFRGVASFWTASATGGSAVRSELSPEILKSAEAAFGSGIADWGGTDFRFSWAPSGRAIYFARTLGGTRNLWRMSVDPQTLRATGIEPMTTGTGFDTELSLSPDGKKIAFTGGSSQIRAWLFRFDPTHGHVAGSGQAVTSPGVEAWKLNLSRDGKKLAFRSRRGGKWNVWESSLSDGHEAPVIADDYERDGPAWSPDGTRLAYERQDSSRTQRVMLWSSQSRNEEQVTESSESEPFVYDWSPDGKWLLISKHPGSEHNQLWLLPVAAKPHAERAARKIAADPAYDLFEPHFSPNGRWIAFNAVTVNAQPRGNESTIYVTSATGGPWIRITEGKHWDDKPRWSPDGNAIYFLTERGGFLNVWGIRFDSARGRPVSEPFPVTAFNSLRLMVPKVIAPASFSLSQDHLVVTVAQSSGNIWVLDNVGQ
jgi:Tol biopolymer transport system component/DNA-binding winged helix-turn-helix (wHTH) protein